MLQLPQTAQASTRRVVARSQPGPSSPPVIVVPAPNSLEPSKQLKDAVPFNWTLQDEQVRRGVKLLRQARKARGADCSPQRLFKASLAAEKAAAKAAETVRAKKRTLQDNEKIDYVSVVVGYRGGQPVSSVSPGEIIRQFDDWIKEVQGNPDRVRHLQQMKISKLEDLASTIERVLEGQKQNGLWELRADEGAKRHAAWRLTHEAVHLKLRTVDDCLSATKFLQGLARIVGNNIDDELNGYHVEALARNVTAALASLNPMDRRKGTRR